jgi:uncharacterized protein (DUF305 family)
MGMSDEVETISALVQKQAEEIKRMREVIETWHSLSVDKAQHRKTAEAIMRDILKRKGLSSAWKDWWDLATEDTKVAVINAWVDIMINGDGEVSEPNEAA